MNIDKIVKRCKLESDMRKYMDEIKKCYGFNREELKDNALKRINMELPVIVECTPYYKALYQEGNFPDKVDSLEEFEQIPFVTKQSLREQYPFGFLNGSMDQVVRYGESTGTSGSPTSSFMSKKDWEENIARVTLHLSNFFSKKDIVFIMIPFELAFSAVDMDKSLWNIGSCVVAIGAKNQVCPIDRVAEMMMKVKPTALICSPTRAIRLYYLLKEKGYEPEEVGLKTILYIGETCSDAKLDKIKEMWGGVQLTTIYGFTETNSIALPCEHNRSHLVEDRSYFELVDPKSGETLKNGKEGELVITTLRHEAFPLIRFRTGDYVRIEDTPCTCGLRFRTIKHLGRYMDRKELNGHLFMKNDLENSVLSIKGTGCNFMYSIEEGELQIAVDIIVDEKEAVKQQLIERLQDKYGAMPHVYELDRKKYFEVVDSSLKPGSIDWSAILDKGGLG